MKKNENNIKKKKQEEEEMERKNQKERKRGRERKRGGGCFVCLFIYLFITYKNDVTDNVVTDMGECNTLTKKIFKMLFFSGFRVQMTNM